MLLANQPQLVSCVLQVTTKMVPVVLLVIKQSSIASNAGITSNVSSVLMGITSTQQAPRSVSSVRK